jgi:signal transduction histidine kinase
VRICLSSDSIEIPAQLQEIRNIDWIYQNPRCIIPDADLYIWDYTPGLGLQSCVLERRGAQHLVITDPKYLDVFDEVHGFVCILLKPVAPFTLKAFVELALKSRDVYQQAREAETLRLDRDTLLQYVLEVNLKLQQYDQERSNFLARALHDFRTPLTALQGYCGLLANGKLGHVSARQHELLERMSRSTQRLTRLAGGTLDLLLQGRLEKRIERRETNIEEILRRALDDVYPFVQDKSLRVTTRITPPDGILLLEPEQIQQVFVNLLENSSKFTPKNGRIQIHGYTVDSNSHCKFEGAEPDLQPHLANWYRVDVSDSGPGVPNNLAERIFEEYASYSGSTDRSGGGLGLAICKAIVTAHGGTIWATPNQEGGKFSLIFPMTPFQMHSVGDHPVEATSELETADCQ